MANEIVNALYRRFTKLYAAYICRHKNRLKVGISIHLKGLQ